ncbi:RNA chaperone ProQ [Alteromonas sediminis]|uniref:RNA chaperone ProQ n=1 Tax=Alteromonas sediminis TaxID=2259342 RepID=A0A3N5Y169_9ALTE|nr:RNA chaperone ProQ [Alteromonas sediminis]RPJ67332.1 RNA chaperone ProQ [Alteromonas sediminis]
MESTEKFTSSKEVIAFLCESFPECFSLQGDAKPLKIGIFQDLAEKLTDEPRVSKTLLRSSLRHYTNSWRYLHSVKEGAFRVDLEGKQGEAIEKEHAEHAAQQLKESKAKVAEKKQAEQKLKGDDEKPKRNKGKSFKGTKRADKHSKKVVPAKLSESDLQTGTNVTVKLGKVPMHAVITEVAKEGVHVQLDSGMTMKVDANTLRLAPTKR